MLELKLLGSPQILLHQQPVTGLSATKSQALLFYLAVQERPQSRLALAGLLWPDKPEGDALANVRQAFYHLRNALTDYLIINRATVALNAALPAQVDVLLFEKECAAANPFALRQAAVERYTGDFLAGFYVDNADPFEEWAVVMRERLHRLATTTLQDLVTHFVAQQETQSGLRYANQWLTLEPWQEKAHRAKIQLLAWEGQTQAALTHYERCRHLLAEELGAEPAAETVALVEQIRQGELRITRPEGARELRNNPKLSASSPAKAVHTGNTSDASQTIVTRKSEFVNQHDWGEMPDVRVLWGRDGEMAQLEQWLVTEQQRVVTILGIGGMGKTTLAATMATRLAPRFTLVLWRSLLNAPPLSAILRDWVQTLAGYTLATWPALLDAQLALLFAELRRQRCLLILDNVESILSPADEQQGDAYRPDYADYGQFFARLGESAHQSSLLLTSRELPPELARLERRNAPVRRLPLPGLSLAAGQQLLADAGLIGNAAQQQQLLTRYSGNPLALQLVGKTIQDFFASEIAAFLSDETLLFDDVREMLDQQFARLTGLERDLLLWLAIEREPVALPTLQQTLLYAGAKSAILDALLDLQQRALLEKLPTGFTLQNVIMEYATAYLVDAACHEIETATPRLLHSHALLRAQAKAYVRESQVRLLLRPIGERLQKKLGRDGVMAKLKALLTVVRQSAKARTSYAGGNLLNLLVHYQEEGQADLQGVDFSNLAVWQAYLPGAELVGVNFANGDLTNCVFAEQFGVMVSMAFSPDGQILAAGAANDNKIRFWQVKSGQPLGMLVGHSGMVAELAFSPDGKRLASSSYDQTICLWDLQTLGTAAFYTQRPLQTLRNHEAGVWCVVFSADGQHLASGGKDQAARLWDVPEPSGRGQLRHTLHGHTGGINAMAFSPDGQLLATGGLDCTVRLWHVASGQALAQFNGHTGRIWRLAFSPDGRFLASGDWDHQIRLWNLTALLAPGAAELVVSEQARVLTGHEGHITYLRFSADGHTLLSCGDDRTLRLWELTQAGAEVARYALQDHPGRNWSMEITPDGALLAGAGGDLSIRLWDARNGQLLRRLQGHAQDVITVAFDPTGKLLAASCQDHKVRLWDMETQTLRGVLRGHTDGVEDVVFCAPRQGQSPLLASSSVDQTIRLWDVQSGQLLQILRGHTSWIRTIAVSPDGRLLASASNDETVRLWSTATGELLQSWSAPAEGSWCWAVAFSPDGRTLAVGCRLDVIYLWAIDSPNPPPNPVALRGHSYSLTTLAFSPDGALLASGSFDQTVRLWRVQTGETVAILQGHGAWVWRVAFSPDGATLASASEDQTLCLWDVASGQLRHRLQGHSSGVRGVTFSPDGKMVVSGSSDGAIKGWDSQSGACLFTLAAPRPYEGMNISGVTGISEAQKLALKTLGAIEATLADSLRPISDLPIADRRVIEPPVGKEKQRATDTTVVLPIPATLPAEVTGFVGRETEMMQVQQRLADPACRLLTITGMGGVGKSRLALRTAHLLVDHQTNTQTAPFPDGIYYIALAALEPHPQLEHLLATTIAAALGISLAGAATPTTQLLAALAEKDLLLILDNCEHLPVAAFINQILQQTQAVKVLVTSRSRLNVRGEQLIRLAGLTTPTATLPAQVTNDELWRLNDHSAIRLFVQSVQAIVPDFTLDAATAAPVVQLCQLLHGLPLGIELAATWAHLLPLPEIVQEIRQNLDFLESAQLDAPAHQRSLRAVFNHSWQRLTTAEQQALRRLTVFVGGFSREAAVQVAGATLPLLAQLTDKSLVQRVDPADEPPTNGAAGARTRYELLPVVRQYAAEALHQAGETVAYQERYAAYMAQFLAAQRTGLQAAKQREALRTIHDEIENVRTAWQWLLAHLPTAQSALAQIAEQVSQGFDTLFHFYDMRSWFQEGETIFGQLAQQLSAIIPPLTTPVTADEPTVALWRLQAKAQARQGWFAFHLGRYAESRHLLTASLHRLQQMGAAADTIFNLNYLGPLLRQLGEFAQATAYLQEAQRLAQQHNDLLGVSNALNNLGHIALVQGELAEVRHLCQAAVQLKRTLGDRWGMTLSLGYLGRAAQYSEDYAAAQKLFAECLTIARELDDPRGAAFALQCLGDTAYAAGALAAAQAHYQESLSLYQAIGNRAESSVTLARLGETHLAGGETHLARQTLCEALALAWSLPATPGILAALLGLAALALADGQPAQARPALRFVYHHPAGSQEQRKQAAALLATVDATVGNTVDDTASAETTWDLSAYVQMVLRDEQALAATVTNGLPLHAPAAASAPATGLIARNQEMARLEAALTQMLAGQGQVYFVTGEAGSGKSALIRAFVQQSQTHHPTLVVVGALGSAQNGIGDPYLPFRELLNQLTGTAESANDASWLTSAKPIQRLLPQVTTALVDRGADLLEHFVSGAALLAHAETVGNVDGGEWLSRLRTYVAQAQARVIQTVAPPHVFAQYTAVLQQVAAHAPLLLVLDDLQWADASSLSLLFHLIRNSVQSRILLLGAYRPEEMMAANRDLQQNGAQPLATLINECKRSFGDVVIDLDRTIERTGRSFVDAFLDREPNRLGERFRQALFSHTKGHPLFTIELLRDLQERGDLQRAADGYWVEPTAIAWRTLPARVEGVVAVRIGRLPMTLRQLLQAASVEGEEFSAEVAARLLALNVREVIRRLDHELDQQHRLVVAAGIVTNGAVSVTRYRFRHHLFQHYLYHELSEGERRLLHNDVAEALLALYSHDHNAVTMQLAHHLAEAGENERAAAYAIRAGDSSARACAFAEARLHYAQALKLLASLAESVTLCRLRIDTTCKYADAAVSFAPSAPVVAQIRAAEPLLARLPVPLDPADRTRRAWLQRWLGHFARLRNDTTTAFAYLEPLLAEAEALGDEALGADVAGILGWMHLFLGQFAQAEPLLQQTLAFCDKRGNSREWAQSANDLGVVVAHRGRCVEAIALVQRCLQIAQAANDAEATASNHFYLAWVYLIVGEYEQAFAQLRLAVAVEEQAGQADLADVVAMFQGWLNLRQGKVGGALAALAQMQSQDNYLYSVVYPIIQLELVLQADQPEQAATLAAQTLATVTASGDRWGEGCAQRAWAQALANQASVAQLEVDDHFAESLRAFAAGSALLEAARTHVAWGKTLLQRGAPQLAVAHFEQAAAQFATSGLTQELTEVYMLLASLAAKRH